MSVHFNVNILIRGNKIILLVAEDEGAVNLRLSMNPNNAAHLSHELDRANHAIMTGQGDKYVCRPEGAPRKDEI